MTAKFGAPRAASEIFSAAATEPNRERRSGPSRSAQRASTVQFG
jgi:hypothetical protein